MTTSPSGTNRRSLLTVFYVAVVLIALAGQAIGAVEWLGWPLLAALAAVGALEFGGVVISQHALQRQQLGERAIAARIGSAAVAGFAVAFNWLGHDDKLVAGFFAGMSALGYGVWLLDSAARRRDQLRQLGMLAAVPPAFGAARWIRHPWQTRAARALAIETPALGLHGSIAAAAAARRRDARHAAIAVLLRRKLSQGRDRVAAELAIATYDLDEIAARLAAGADYDGLTALLSAELTAARVAGAEPVSTPVADMTVDIRADKTTPMDTVAAQPGKPSDQAMKTEDAMLVAQSMWLQNPDIDLAIIARCVGRSVKTIKRYLVPVGGPASTPPATSPERDDVLWPDGPRPPQTTAALAAA
ncbi:hypothetical protein ABZS66_19340 [Dactylosporangium sp. NPDC005572]|uniref:hypothetical protein n=1 Tax=Dactylosporangium sp. NPDC005572 TaxID=3156889 RepID=UPI0033BD9CA9